MPFLRLFRTKDPLEDAARKLVPAAELSATSFLTALEQRHPFLTDSDFREWRFLATVGGVCVGLNGLLRDVAQERFLRLSSVVVLELQRWSPDGERALRDCRDFTARVLSANKGKGGAPESPTLATASLGMWVLWNLYKRAPTDEEARAATDIGGLIASSFDGWWRQS